MDFLDDLFNSSTLPTERISRMLEEDLFWQIIENSLLDANNLQDQEKALAQELEDLTADDIIGFQLRLEFYSYSLHSPEIGKKKLKYRPHSLILVRTNFQGLC